MALSEKAKARIRTAVGRKLEADEIIAKIETTEATQADVVAGFSSTEDLSASASASALALSTSDTYTDAAVNAAVNAAVDTAVNAAVDALAAEVEARLDDIEAKINEILVALKDAALMAEE